MIQSCLEEDMKLQGVILLFTLIIPATRLEFNFFKRNRRYDVKETPESTEDTGEIKWTLMPDGRGEVRVAVLDGLQPRNQPEVNDSVKFLLYTRNNMKKPEVGTLNTTCRPVFKNYNSKRQSKVLIHGFGDDAKTSLMYPILTEALLEKGDFNVFQVDWGEMAATPWYSAAKTNTIVVGQHTATLIDLLSMTKGGRAGDFHVIGFSLGAHAAGIAASNVRTGNVYHVTGLDPAQVMYGDTGIDEMLDMQDAKEVEIVHTSGGYLGFRDPIGTQDFYPNGGTWPQPGCNYDFAAVCSHRRAYYYYGEAIKNDKGFMAVPCTNYEDFEADRCKNGSYSTYLGQDSADDLPGIYFFDTNAEAPFGKAGKKYNYHKAEEI